MPLAKLQLIILAALALLISVAVELIPLGVGLKFGGLIVIIPLMLWEWKQGTKELTIK